MDHSIYKAYTQSTYQLSPETLDFLMQKALEPKDLQAGVYVQLHQGLNGIGRASLVELNFLDQYEILPFLKVLRVI